MSKDKITDYSQTASLNTDINGINIAPGCLFGNVDDAIRSLLAHLADMNAGTHPLADTVTFGDPADLTKRFRLDGGNITTGTTRVLIVPNTSGTIVLDGGAQTLSGKSFADSTDGSKVLAFALSAISTATTRTATWPNASGTVMLDSQYSVVTALQSAGFGTSDYYLKSTGTNLAWAPVPGGATKRVYTSSTTWTKPTGLVKVVVTVVGGGGGGGGHGNGGAGLAGFGAGGGVSVKTILAASLGATETVTIGAGGAGGTAAPTDGSAGGTSSFGSHCSATGGAGGDGIDTGNALVEAAGGVGSSGDVNSYGGAGMLSQVAQTPFGATPAKKTTHGTGNAAAANSGCGGGGFNFVSGSGGSGGAGGSGIVIVEEYYA